MDRGFELMVPKKKTSVTKIIFDNRIRFCIFGREFNLSFNVKQKQE